MEATQKTMKVTVLRYRPEQDKEPWEQTFDVPYHKDTSVLEALSTSKTTLSQAYPSVGLAVWLFAVLAV